MQEDCHICGQPAVVLAIVENAKVALCPKCSQYGRPVAPIRGQQKPGGQRAQFQSLQGHQAQRQHQPEVDVIEGYGSVIKKGREAQKLTLQQLSAKLFINENVLHRLEEEKLRPQLNTAQKLERALHIKLIVKEGDDKDDAKPGKIKDELEDMKYDGRRDSSAPLTMADVIEIKTKD